MQWTQGFYEVSDSRERLDLDLIAGWIKGTYWGGKRSHEIIRRSWDGSAIVLGAYHVGKPVGCACVISDTVTTAYLADVFLLPEHRGQGVGQFLVRCALEHPDLATVKWLLHTLDMQPLYRRFGFLDRTDRLMERPAQTPENNLDGAVVEPPPAR